MRRHVSSWLIDQIPGAFAEQCADLPALDVITSAWTRPFRDDPPFGPWDYRDALDLDWRYPLAVSPRLPGWTLALENPFDRQVLTLAGRTVEVFDDARIGGYGGVSRSGLASFLWYHGLQDLLCSWAVLNLVSMLHSSLASTRDRARVGESPRAFARRISGDLVELRRGNDAATFCADLLELPARMGPLRALSRVDFTVRFPGSAPADLKASWDDWLHDHAETVRRLGRDQQAWLSTSAHVSGVGANIRLQRQLWILAVVAVVVALTLGILQLTSASGDRDASPAPALRVP